MKKSLQIFSLSLLTALSATNVFAVQADDIEVSDPFAREVPPGAPASASFMTLTNMSDKDIKITSADSAVSKVVELHTHINDAGVMRMRQIPFIEIPAEGTTQLKPGGLHIMLIGPHEPLKQGQEVKVTLKFEDGSSKEVSMPVKSIMGMMHKKPAQEMNHEHMHEHNQNHVH